jgi:hypothetical protein
MSAASFGVFSQQAGGVIASAKLNTNGALFCREGGEMFSACSKGRAALPFCLHCFEENTGDHKAPLWSGLFIALFRASRFPKFPPASSSAQERPSDAESKLASPDRAASVPYRRIVRRYWGLLREVRDHELESSVSKTSSAYPIPWRLVVCGNCREFSPRSQNALDLRIESASFLAFLLDA